jgi:4-hydroxy-4-methyl-2-oxoglutarate aldolase
MHVINWDVERPSRENVAHLAGLAAATLSDAMGRQNSMDHTMKPLWRGARLCGPAVTVKAYACDNLMPHKAMQIAQPGDVLVISAGGHLESALWGDLLTKSAKARGLAGVVIDGGVRDRDDIEALGFPVFSTAVVPGGTYRTNPGSINVPVTVAGAVVEHGDVVVGDADGVVVVPRVTAESTIARARAIAAREVELTERVNRGELIFDILELQGLLERDDVIEVRDELPASDDGAPSSR